MSKTVMTSLVVSLCVLLSACSSPIPNRNPSGEIFPSVKGQTLEKEPVALPDHFQGQPTVILLGYIQRSQFDIDRWLIGLDMRQVQVDFYEVPTVRGWFPSIIQSAIDNGMRKGIPQEIWRNVITVYDDAEKIQQFTGNVNAGNARVMVLDGKGQVRYFYDRGFSTIALNEVISTLAELK